MIQVSAARTNRTQPQVLGGTVGNYNQSPRFGVGFPFFGVRSYAAGTAARQLP